MTTYKILHNNVPVKNKPTFFASTIGRLKKGTKIKVTSINGIWANFKFKNKSAYILTFYLKKVEIITTGSIKIRYLNVDTNEEIAPYVTHDSLELKSYSYTAPALDNYTVVEPSTISVTLSSSKANQEVKFYYRENKVYGSVTIKYIDKNTQTTLAESRIYSNLELGSYSYHSIDIEGYRVLGESTKSITLTKNSHDATIVFEYTQIFGKVTVKYIDVDTKVEITEPDVHTDLTIGEYTYSAKSISGYVLVSTDAQITTLTYDNFVQVIVFEYKKYDSEDSIYTIDLEKYNISNDNTNATNTTKGINQALVDAKSAGYKIVQLPKGHYAIDTSVKNDIVLSDGTNTWTHHRQGITMQSDMELILEDSILQMIPCEDPYYSILTISNCNNSKITGGTILGDKLTHYYGMKINKNGTDFKPGSVDEETGEEIESETDIITDYIDKFVKYDTKEVIDLPKTMCLIPLWNTYFNSVDGGKKRIYCYDSDDNYLGVAGNWMFDVFTLLDNTTKIKIRILNEQLYDNDYHTNVYALTTRTLYQSAEFAMGICIAASSNIEINGTTIKNITGDCITTFAPPIGVTVDNLKILNCDIGYSRRQGISFVGNGENYLIQNCKIHNINGIDPQFGIDIEHYGYVRDVTIDGCNFYNNRKGDIINFNGTNNIEVKNSTFNGQVASTFGKELIVHDCNFKYEKGVNDSEQRTKGNTGLHLSTDGNVGYNNTFINATYNVQTASAVTYNNIIKGGNAIISQENKPNESPDKFYNCMVRIAPSSSFNSYGGVYFENCEINEDNKNSSISLKNITFNNSTYFVSNDTKFNKCSFNMKDKSVINGWRAVIAKATFTECSFNSTYSNDIRLLGNNLNLHSIFDNCNFNISRYKLSNSYNTLTFNECRFIFNELNNNPNPVPLDWPDKKWNFIDCYFESKLPIQLLCGNVINPTIKGSIIIV